MSPGSKSYTVDEALRLTVLMARQRGMDAQEGRELAAQHRPLSRPRVPPLSAYPSRLGSARTTGRAGLVDQAPKFGAPRAEATVQELVFDYLDAPVGRIGAIRTGMPESPPL